MFDETVFNRTAGGLSDLDKSIKALNDNIKALRRLMEATEKATKPIDLTEYDIGVPITKRIGEQYNVEPKGFPEPWPFPHEE